MLEPSVSEDAKFNFEVTNVCQMPVSMEDATSRSGTPDPRVHFGSHVLRLIEVQDAVKSPYFLI